MRPGILFVINDLQPGGAEMFMFRLAAHLQDRFSIFILSLNPENDDEAFVAAFQDQQTFQRISLPLLKEKGIKNRLFWRYRKSRGYSGENFATKNCPDR